MLHIHTHIEKWGKWYDSHFTPYCKQVTKIGRDAVLYVESLIESIMGGLEGLINILDSEGGFGALETQVHTSMSYFNIKEYLNLILPVPWNWFWEISQLLPEQAASYINHASKVSIPSTKSPKLAASFPLPGHESYPENNSSIKMYVFFINCVLKKSNCKFSLDSLTWRVHNLACLILWLWQVRSCNAEVDQFVLSFEWYGAYMCSKPRFCLEGGEALILFFFFFLVP